MSNGNPPTISDETVSYLVSSLTTSTTEAPTKNPFATVSFAGSGLLLGHPVLTVDRVRHFDEAFTSRVYLSIGYQRLDDNAWGNIWDNLFAKLEEGYKNGVSETLYDYDAKQYAERDSGV